MLFGFFRSWKKYLLIFLPIFGFILFHVLYPNKQERFILPALPFVVILGVIGWNEFVATSRFWNSRQSLLRACWTFFWTVNTIAMLVLCITYTKKDRVEAMTYLYDQGDARNFALEYTDSESGSMMPEFYSGLWTNYYYWNKGQNPADYIVNMKSDEEETRNDLHTRPEPNYYLFYDGPSLERRVEAIRKFYPSLQYKTTIESGWFDKTLHWLNPNNSLETIHIYKVERAGSAQ